MDARGWIVAQIEVKRPDRSRSSSTFCRGPKGSKGKLANFRTQRHIPGNGMKLLVRNKPKRVDLGEHIVADPLICHGKPTFKGTRIMVFQVLEQVAYGTPWERIVWSWRGKVPMEAITEAVKLASGLFQDQSVFKPHARHRRKHLGKRSLAAA